MNVLDEILNECKLQNKNYILSKTGEDEILIYTFVDGTYRNIIIDDENGIEFLFIHKDRSKTFNEYYGTNYVNIKELVSLL
jgi:hypothetical protein